MNRWLLLAFVAMVFNGVVLVTLRGVEAYYGIVFVNHYLALSFLVGAVVCWSVIIVRRARPRLAHVALGAAAGIVSYVGNLFLVLSLEGNDSYLVFPIVCGSQMMLVTVVSRWIFGERLSRRSVCAVVVGTVSLIILAGSAEAGTLATAWNGVCD